MNGVSYYRLFVGFRVVGVAYSAADAVAFYNNTLGAAVYRVYDDGTSIFWMGR